MKTIRNAISQARESYDNLAKLYDLVGFKYRSHIMIAGDLEVSSLLTGNGNDARRYPCAYCFSMSSRRRPLRSVVGNEKYFLALTQTSGIAKHRNFFFSCHSPPTVRQPGPVIFFCRPPPPHLKLGTVNQLMTSLFEHSPNLVEKLKKELGILRKEYHGSSFEGEKSSKLI